jgi:hypothetical protein
MRSIARAKRANPVSRINYNLSPQYWSRDSQWPIDHRHVRNELSAGIGRINDNLQKYLPPYDPYHTAAIF